MKKFVILMFCLAMMPAFAEHAEDNADAVEAPAEVTLSTFYEQLAPYGKWVEDSDLGWVWQPSEVVSDSDWRPYCHGGHWQRTDAGWYWASDYKWGWAAFHYGRWCRHNKLGWAWVPDCTWGPAWVSFRECDTNFGWAPLPPRCEFDAALGFSFRGNRVAFGFEFGLGIDDYFFCPCGSFLEVNLWHHHCRHDEVLKFYNRTVIHNRYVFRNNCVVHEGIDCKIVEKRLNRRIEEHRIKSAHFAKGEIIRGERREGKEISVYRPEVKRISPIDPKTAVTRHEERREEIHRQQEQRRDLRQDQKHERQELRQEQKHERQEARPEPRQERQEQRHEQRQERQEQHQEQRHERQEQRQEQRHEAPMPRHSEPAPNHQKKIGFED